jgi:hypothetical protein
MRDHFSIRAASSDDAEEVTALLQVAYPRLMAASYTPEQLRALEVMTQANPKLLQSGTFYVVQNEQGRVVACGGWTCERPGMAVWKWVWRTFGILPPILILQDRDWDGWLLNSVKTPPAQLASWNLNVTPV